MRSFDGLNVRQEIILSCMTFYHVFDTSGFQQLFYSIYATMRLLKYLE